MKHPIEFLQALRPNGPWIVTAIHPDERNSRTGDALIRTRTVASKENLDDFLSDNDGFNIYYSLNPTMGPMEKKPKREDVALVDYLHVDIDPRAGEDLESEHARIEKLLRNLPDGIPRPTAVVFSGGGYNLLWKLEESIPIHGDLPKAEDAKLYNLRLETVLGGDHCHNIDRILRLPGTTNFPNARKRKKGREVTESKLVYFNPELVYPIDRFQKAQRVALNDGTTRKPLLISAPKIEISGNIPRLSEQELEALALDMWVETLIIYGTIPDEPNRYASRSEGLFAAVCAMVRKGVSDEKIYSIITDPEYKISESVLDKGASIERYALHQIHRAKLLAIDPALMEMNDEFAVIENVGGRVRVVRFVEDAVTALPRSQRFSFGDFENLFLHDQVEIPHKRFPDDASKNRKIGRGLWWLQHPERRQFKQLVFLPGKDVEGALNLWQGFAVPARPPEPGQLGKHESFLRHVRDNVCDGNEEHYDYLIKWMARAVQKPDSQGEACVVFKGGQGTGKGIVAREFGKLFGAHFKHVSDISRITGTFNLHLQDCVVLFGDEMTHQGDKKHAAALKRLITEPTLDIRALYHDAEQTPNYLHIMLASNEERIVDIDADDRRFFVLEVGQNQKQNRRYFKRIIDDLDNGGRENLLFFLQSVNLNEPRFDVREIPQTAALAHQKMRSLNPVEEWWFEKLERGYLIDDDTTQWAEEVPVDTMKSDFAVWDILTNGRRSKDVKNTTNAMNAFLERVTDGRAEKVQASHDMNVRVDQNTIVMKKRPYVFRFPSLEFCRRVWDEIMKMETSWPER